MKKYIKPAIEIINVNTEYIMAAVSPDPNSLYDMDGYSQPGGDDDDGDGLVDDM